MSWFSTIPRFRIVRRRVSLKGRRAHYLLHKEKARMIIEAKVAHYSAVYGLTYNRIFVRNQKSRWGSCSVGKNLNFHYKLALLPERLMDYVIVHEVCHLAHMNHAPAFWAHVAQACPDYKRCRKELRSAAIIAV